MDIMAGKECYCNLNLYMKSIEILENNPQLVLPMFTTDIATPLFIDYGMRRIFCGKDFISRYFVLKQKSIIVNEKYLGLLINPNPENTNNILNPKNTNNILNPQNTNNILNPQNTNNILNPQNLNNILELGKHFNEKLSYINEITMSENIKDLDLIELKQKKEKLVKKLDMLITKKVKELNKIKKEKRNEKEAAMVLSEQYSKSLKELKEYIKNLDNESINNNNEIGLTINNNNEIELTDVENRASKYLLNLDNEQQITEEYNRKALSRLFSSRNRNIDLNEYVLNALKQMASQINTTVL